MRNYVLLLLAVLWAQLGLAQSATRSSAAVSTLTILPEDVVKESIKLVPFKDNTNRFLLTLDYSERGVKKLVAFKSAHAGQMIRNRYGTYETKPRLASTNSLAAAAPGKSPKMQAVLQLNAAEANTVLTALKAK